VCATASDPVGSFLDELALISHCSLVTMGTTTTTNSILLIKTLWGPEIFGGMGGFFQ
jgi:hypothetical protein